MSEGEGIAFAPQSSPAAPERSSARPRGGQDTEKYALLLLGAAVFFGAWSRLRVGSINFTLADFAATGCFLLLLSRQRLKGAALGPLTPFWIGGLGVMLTGLFVSSIINGDPVRWLSVAAQYSFAYLVIPWLIMSQERIFAVRLCLLYVLGVTLSEVIGIIASYLLSYSEAMSIFGQGFLTGNRRLGAMSQDANPNGAAVAFAVPMLIYLMRRKVVPGYLGLLFAVILGWGLMLSASFTGFFATAIGLCLVILVIGPKYIARLILVVVGTATLFYASGASLPLAFQKRVGIAVETGNIGAAGTYDNRADLIKEAWGFTQDYNLIGMGVDQYRELSVHENPVHNLYLLIWTEGGVIALCGLLALIMVCFTLAISNFKRHRIESAMSLAIFCIFLIYSMSYPHMYARNWMIPIMVALATIYAGIPLKPRGRMIAPPARTEVQ